MNNIISKDVCVTTKIINFDDSKNKGLLYLSENEYSDLVRIIIFGDSAELCGRNMLKILKI